MLTGRRTDLHTRTLTAGGTTPERSIVDSRTRGDGDGARLRAGGSRPARDTRPGEDARGPNASADEVQRGACVASDQTDPYRDPQGPDAFRQPPA